MAIKTDSELLAEAAIIKNATIPNTNTPIRVGQMLEDLINSKINVDDTGGGAGVSIKDMGDYDASTNLLPDVGTATGSGIGGAIMKGDEFTFSVAGTIGGEDYPIGTIARSKINAPGQTLTNWRLY